MVERFPSRGLVWLVGFDAAGSFLSVAFSILTLPQMTRPSEERLRSLEEGHRPSQEEFADHEEDSLLPSRIDTGRRFSFLYEDPRKNGISFLASCVGFVVLAIIGCLVWFALGTQHGGGSSPGLVTGQFGAVAAEDETCSNIGVEVLKENGNAIDAAIASGICIGAINSFSSGIGGGGFMTIRLPDGTAEVVDFREKAPAAATENMFVADPGKSQMGGLAVGVPGELRGYGLAHRRHGKLPWARLLQPTIDLCENGFEVSTELFSRLEPLKEFLLSAPGFRDIFTTVDPSTNQTVLAQVGTRIYRRNLAKTLRLVSSEGEHAFYNGDIARSIVRTVTGSSGVMTLKDLREYQPVLREPVVGYYRGRKITTAPPPSSGPVLLQILNVLDGYEDPQSQPFGVMLVRLVEAFKWGYAARTELGDPAFLNITERINEIINPGHAAEIRRQIHDDETFPLVYYHPKFDFMETPGTTHLSVVDKDDMAVSMTSTVNLAFGAKLMVEEWGIILNNQMDDFSSPNITNAFGLRPSKNNFIRPGKRPLSSSVPTIIERNGQLEGVFGASGGSRIITGTAQSIIHWIDYEMNVYASIAAPRVHHQLMPETVDIDYGYPQLGIDALQRAGHNITMNPQGYKGSDVQGVVRLFDGTIEAASDPRKHGKAAAY